MVDATTTAPTLSDADAAALVKAVEAAGYVHELAPPGFPTPGHAQAAAMPAVEVDHLKSIADLAAAAKTATPSGVDTIADQILAHVDALQGGK